MGETVWILLFMALFTISCVTPVTYNGTTVVLVHILITGLLTIVCFAFLILCLYDILSYFWSKINVIKK